MTEKETFISVHNRECMTALNLLKAFPADQLDLRPAPKSRSAKELAFVLANQERFFQQAADGAIDFSLFANPVPATLDEIIAVLGANHKAADEAIGKASDADLNKMVNFGGHDMRRLMRSGPISSTWFITGDSFRFTSVLRGPKFLRSTGPRQTRFRVRNHLKKGVC